MYSSALILIPMAVGCLVARPAWATWPNVEWPHPESMYTHWQELEQDCRTISAFDYDPTPRELNQALARAGSNGRTRLDLGLSLITRAAGGRQADTGEYPMLPLPTWIRPLDAARAIAAAKTMAGVKELVLDGFPLTAEAAGLLAASVNLGALEVLSLSRARVTGPALHALLAPGALPALVELDLTNNPLKAADLDELAARLAERNLRSLKLGASNKGYHDTPIKRFPHDAAALAALARIASAPSLATLGLGNERIGFAELEALLEAKRVQPLEIEIAGLPNLAERQLAALAALDPDLHVTFAVADLGIKPALLRALAQSGLLGKVSALGLRCGDACAQTIARSSHAGHLRKLDFGCEENVAFSWKTGAALARATSLSALRELSFENDIEGCKADGLGAKGLRFLIGAPFAGQIEALTFVDQGLNGTGFIALAQATSLTALKRLAAMEEETILTPDNVRLLFRDGALASHLEVLRLSNESNANLPLAELAKGLRMPKLRVLELPFTTPPSLREWLRLVRAPGWREIRVLSVPRGSPPAEGDEARSSDRLLREIRDHLAPDACLP